MGQFTRDYSHKLITRNKISFLVIQNKNQLPDKWRSLLQISPKNKKSMTAVSQWGWVGRQHQLPWAPGSPKKLKEYMSSSNTATWVPELIANSSNFSVLVQLTDENTGVLPTEDERTEDTTDYAHAQWGHPHPSPTSGGQPDNPQLQGTNKLTCHGLGQDGSEGATAGGEAVQGQRHTAMDVFYFVEWRKQVRTHQCRIHIKQR